MELPLPHVELPVVKFPVDQVRLPILPATVLLTFPLLPMYCDLLVGTVKFALKELPNESAESIALSADSKPAVRGAGWGLPDGTWKLQFRFKGAGNGTVAAVLPKEITSSIAQSGI